MKTREIFVIWNKFQKTSVVIKQLIYEIYSCETPFIVTWEGEP